MTKEEAIKRIKDWNLDNDKIEVLSVIIPELAESEEEKLSKKLHECVCRAINNDKLPYEERKYISEKVIPYLENLEKQKEQKATWNEEDDIEISVLINALGEFETYGGDFTKEKNWLKSLKKRMQPQSIQELSKEVIIEYVDLGLPSGTFWKLINEKGYYTFDEAVEKFSNQLPTKEQWEELKKNCNWKWKGNGYDVTGPNGNMIFLPTNGYRLGTNVHSVGMYGSYWSSKHYNNDFAYYMGFGANFLDVNYYSHNTGRSVRLVKQ